MLQATSLSVSLITEAVKGKWLAELQVYAALRAFSVDTAGWLVPKEVMVVKTLMGLTDAVFSRRLQWLHDKGAVTWDGKKIHVVSLSKTLKLLCVEKYGFNTVAVEPKTLQCDHQLFRAWALEVLKADYIKKKWIALRRPSKKICERDKVVVPAKLQQKASDYLCGKSQRNVGACSVRLSSEMFQVSKAVVFRLSKLATKIGWSKYTPTFDVAIDKLKIKDSYSASEVSEVLNLKRPLLFDKRMGIFRLRIADTITSNITILYSNTLNTTYKAG